MTNFERIQNMSIEQVAVMLADEIPHGDCYGCNLCENIEVPRRLGDACRDGWLGWLESEVADNE